MSKKTEQAVALAARPYDNKGRFIPLDCPRLNCGGGVLRPEGDALFSYWQCDGLASPDREDQELYACDFHHIDGQPYDDSNVRAHAKSVKGRK